MKNKQGVGRGKYSQPIDRSQDSKDLIDLVETTPIKTPKVSPAVKKEIKRKIPSYLDGAMKEFDEQMNLDESVDP
jgi:hypothetical protein